jgi:2-amino-4-hydroxy-6-hydroxymethyldihydropteridine diphosphokinase
MSPIVYLGLGTNLGDRSANLKAGVDSISADAILLVCSSVYQTTPWGFTDQPDFYNQVIKIESELPATDLLKKCKSIEQAIGRQPSFRYGPRLIDIDILLYNEMILDTPDLTIPHPRLIERSFMLVPLLEITPDLVHPGTGVAFSQYLNGLETSGVTRLTEAS